MLRLTVQRLTGPLLVVQDLQFGLLRPTTVEEQAVLVHKMSGVHLGDTLAEQTKNQASMLRGNLRVEEADPEEADLRFIFLVPPYAAS